MNKNLKNAGPKELDSNLPVDARLNSVVKKVKNRFRSNSTNNKRKDIIKVISSLENRGILLKGSTRNVTSQEKGFLNFFRSLMTAGLPIKKNVVQPLAKTF